MLSMVAEFVILSFHRWSSQIVQSEPHYATTSFLDNDEKSDLISVISLNPSGFQR